MRYQIPQFIEVEDKIFGPLTVKQFLYLGGSAALAYMIYNYFPWFLSYLICPLLIIFGVLLAFYKINNKPFINIVEAFIRYTIGAKLYIWKRGEAKKKTAAEGGDAAPDVSAIFVPKLSDSKLKDLAWSLDVNEKISSTIFSKETKGLIPRTERQSISS